MASERASRWPHETGTHGVQQRRALRIRPPIALPGSTSRMRLLDAGYPPSRRQHWVSEGADSLGTSARLSSANSATFLVVGMLPSTSASLYFGREAPGSVSRERVSSSRTSSGSRGPGRLVRLGRPTPRPSQSRAIVPTNSLRATRTTHRTPLWTSGHARSGLALWAVEQHSCIHSNSFLS